MKFARGCSASLLLALVLSLNASTALAGVIGPNFISVTATNAAGTGAVNIPVPPEFRFPDDGIATVTLPEPQTIRNAGGTALATLDSLTLTMIEDPSVSVAFAVTAFSSDTTFSLTTATLAFPAILNPNAVASASATLTDNNGNGATLTGLQTGARQFRATYNGSTDWAFLVNSLAAPAFGSVAGTGERPIGGGFEVIPGSVGSISAQYNFTLSANDSASGTGQFTVVPEPASIGLLCLAGVALVAHRRR
jgi:hypothetical protein